MLGKDSKQTSTGTFLLIIIIDSECRATEIRLVWLVRFANRQNRAYFFTLPTFHTNRIVHAHLFVAVLIRLERDGTDSTNLLAGLARAAILSDNTNRHYFFRAFSANIVDDTPSV